MAAIKGLGYLYVTSTDVDRWRELAVDCLGMQEVDGPFEGALHLRLDERAYRVVVQPGESDNVLAIGWEVRDLAGLKEVKDALAAAGIDLRDLALLSSVSTVLSNLVSNVPAVMLLTRFLDPAAPAQWYALAVSSTFAGNLITIGSIANLIVIEGARNLGIAVTFKEHARVGVPVTLLSLGILLGWIWVAG